MAGHAVSFVLTVHNKAPYLVRVLASVAAQEGAFEREVIVVDDGSTDGSQQILAAVGPDLPGFRLIVEPHRGPAVATNRGLAEAAMPLVKLLDGDDLLAPYATRHLIEVGERCGALARHRRERAVPAPRSARAAAARDLVHAEQHADPPRRACGERRLRRARLRPGLRAGPAPGRPLPLCRHRHGRHGGAAGGGPRPPVAQQGADPARSQPCAAAVFGGPAGAAGALPPPGLATHRRARLEMGSPRGRPGRALARISLLSRRRARDAAGRLGES